MYKILLIGCLCLVSANLSALGPLTATVTIVYGVESISAISISSNPGPLIVRRVIVGGDFVSDTDTSTNYAITTNNRAMRITAALSMPMPPGVTLSLNMVAPRGATSLGTVPLDTAPSDIITGISNVSEGGLSIIYVLSATENARPIKGALNTITYTIGP